MINVETPERFKGKTKETISLILCLSILFSFSLFSPSVKASLIYVDSSFYFGFNSGWLNFNTSETFTTIYETTDNYWYFDQVGISLDGSNCTVVSWISNNQTIFSLTSLSGTCTILMNVSTLNPSITVQGAAYTVNSTLLTITKSSFSTATVTINMSPLEISNFSVSNYGLAQNVPFIFSTTVYDEWGIVSLSSVNVELSNEYQIIASWNLGTFTLTNGAPVCNLDVSGCSVTQIDTYTTVLSWKLTLLGTQPEQTVSVLAAGTLVSDAYGNTATNSLFDLATYTGPPTNSGGTYTPPTNPNNPSENQTGPETPTNQTQSQNPPVYTQPENVTNGTGPFIPPNPDIPAIEATIPFSPMILYVGIICIFMVVGVTGFYAGRKKNPLSEAQKEWKKQNKGKNAKWNQGD